MNDLRDIQLKELDLIRKTIKVFKKYNLTYYVSGGTFLGAVRDHGFIPWDDDADLAMPREDYEKFLEITSKEILPINIKNYKLDTDFPYYVTKVIDDKFELIDKSGVSEKRVPIWIDIFPLDGVPKNKLKRKIHGLNLMSKRALYNLSMFDTIVKVNKKNRPLIERLIIWVGANTNISQHLDPVKRMDAIDKALKKYPSGKSDYFMNFMGAYKLKSIISKEVYGKGAYYNFEDIELFGPKDYNQYLTIIYGDYMKPPVHKNVHFTEVVK